MTVALLLAAAPDRLSAMTQPYRQPGDRAAGGPAGMDGVSTRLMAAGVRQVEVAMCADAADGLRAVAAVARGSGEPVLVCTVSRALATPGTALAALLAGTGSAAVTASGTLLAARQDLAAVADAAEALAARIGSGGDPDDSRENSRAPPRLSARRISRRTRVSGELNDAMLSLIDRVTGSGVRLTLLNVRDAASIDRAPDRQPGWWPGWPRPRRPPGSLAGRWPAVWGRTRSPSPRSRSLGARRPGSRRPAGSR